MFTDVLTQDEMILEKLTKIERDTHYRLVYDKKSEVSTGRLGEFADCLKGYRNINSIRSNKGDVNHLKLAVSSNLYLEMNVIDGEVYRFDAIYSENEFVDWPNGYVENRKRSRSYAVNCSLDLLKVK